MGNQPSKRDQQVEKRVSQMPNETTSADADMEDLSEESSAIINQFHVN